MPPRHVLVIDDEDDIRQVVSLSLELTEGWTVQEEHAGLPGAARALASRPDVILLDVMMPGMDGPSTLLALQSAPVTASIPVIFLTAKVQVSDRERFMHLGARGIIQKPFDPLTLGAQIRDILFWS